MGFCVTAETFVAEKLSNWYVRRNRRRFWKSERSEDKLAAYQTLYTVLTTLTRLLSPIMPFLTEIMYQNLERSESADTSQPVSIHHCDFPQLDKSMIDADLSADMEALLRLVSLGSAARNSVRIKVRQPLAEIVIQPANVFERRAAERFAEQISDELNLKKVRLHDPAQGALLRYDISPNLKTLGPRFGERVKEIRTALAAFEPEVLEAKVQGEGNIELDCAGTAVVLDKNDLLVKAKAPEGWAGLTDSGTQLLLDVRITEELAREGMAREVVRHVQELRKKSALEMEDRIVLHLATDSSLLRSALQAHNPYISAETLAVEWASGPLDGDSHSTQVKVDGHALMIQLRKVAAKGVF
jgi:isoleucyl-tRNA synthetase